MRRSPSSASNPHVIGRRSATRRSNIACIDKPGASRAFCFLTRCFLCHTHPDARNERAKTLVAVRILRTVLLLPIVWRQCRLSLRCEKHLRHGANLHARSVVSTICQRDAKQIAGWSYPAKRVLKSDVSIITYQHSNAKHLENSPARHSLEGFVKNF